MPSHHKLARVVAPYLICALVMAIYKLSQSFEITIDEFIWLLLFLSLFSCLFLATRVLLTRRSNIARSKLNDFPNAPWLFERGSVEIIGRIDRVIPMRISSNLRTYLNSIKQTILASGDRTETAIHQRFLITSPTLLKGEQIMIVHNTAFGSIPLEKGSWVHVKGQYIHRRAPKARYGQRKLSFYGLIHYTHEPRGFVKLFQSKPDGSLKVKAERYIDQDGAESVSGLNS